MRINNNISALNAFNALTRNNNNFTNVIHQLSTGMRINSASDDAAGLAISETIRSQVSGLNRAMQNAQDGISLLQTAEGALGETNSMVQRMRELAVQAANDTLTSQDRSYLQMEIDALKDQIDSIARNTQFNTKSLLDGSLCGTWTSTDTTTKAYIRGSLETEGNFRIELKADPGAAQVQKSNIFKIKHENVVTNAQLNADNGIGQVKIDGMPAGDYVITATKPGGGEVTNVYKTTVNVKSGNSSGIDSTRTQDGSGGSIPEAILIRLTAENEDGTQVYWPRPGYGSGNGSSYYNNYMSSSYEGYRYIAVPSDCTDPKSIAQLIESEINQLGGSVTMVSNYSNNNATQFEIKAEADENGNCIISSPSKNGAMIRAEFKVLPGTTMNLNNDKLTRTQYLTINTAKLQGRVENINAAGDTVEIKIEYNGDSKSVNVAIPAGADEDAAAAQILREAKSIGTISVGGKDITVKGLDSTESNQFGITASAGDDDESIKISISSSTSDTVLYPSVSGIEKTYTTQYDGKVTHGNTSNNIEKLRIRVSNGDYGYIDVDVPAGADKQEISRLIASKVREMGSVQIGGSNVLISAKFSGPDTVSSIVDSTLSEGEFYIKATDADKAVSFSVYYLAPEQLDSSGNPVLDANGKPVKAEASTQITDGDNTTANVIDTLFTVDQDAQIISSGANSTLTGFYGSDGSANLLHLDTNIDTQNNASILFEVTAQAFDENGKGTITLSAQSHVLGTDGKTSNYTDSKIVVSTGAKTVDVSSLLGESAGSVKLTIDDPAKFTAGNKFVWNVSGNGTSDAKADTSLYINSSQDSTWPYTWSDKNTYKGNTLYYNVNAEKVSNRDVKFRNYYLNSENGKVHDGEIKLTFNKDFSEKAANFPDVSAVTNAREQEITLASFTANYVGKIATGEIRLRDIEQFWNSSGVFMLEEPQVITVSQNDGKRTQITLNASDTLNDVKNKLNDAIANGLGQGLYVKGGNANNFVTFVENPTGNNGLETVKGTFLIRSVIPGSKGELTFSSSYGNLIDSLGLNTVHESKDTSYTASVYNAHDNTLIARNIKTADNMLKGVIDKNVDVEFSAMSSISAVWSDADKNFILTPDSEYYVTNLHLAKNDLNFQTGAGEGDHVTLDIGNMSSEALGIKGVNVMTFERASKAITILDNAVRQISSQRTKIGSYQNALESAIENLTVTGTNLTSSDSRIRDTDMAKTMMEFVKFQIINQSGTSMLSQANQTTRTVLSLLQ